MDFKKFKEEISKFRDFSSDDYKLIKEAFYFGEKAFSGINRKSGEPYFNHCLRTALNLAKLHLDEMTIVSGILHDVLEDTSVSETDLKNLFEEEVLFLVKGVSKVSNVKYKNENIEQAEYLRNFILSISKDLRVALIKLADRLDNMRTLEYLPPEKQKRIALETRDIYAPLALRFGLGEWAGELDDLAFKFLEPEKYKEIVNLIEEKVKNGEEILKEVKEKLTEELNKRNMNLIDIQSRIKKPSSVYKKLKRKNFDINQIYDLLALRVIVQTVEECYISLGVVHNLYQPVLEEFDDYIAFPKPNGYQSLHTTCYLPEKRTYLEFQIRTEEMHIKNEEGIAAYFAYADFKQTKGYQKGKVVFVDNEKLKLIQEIKKWKELINNKEFLSSIKTDFLKEKIYVFTPKGEIIELPQGSTPLDFAYKIHSELGNTYAGAKVNGKMVPIDYELKTGEIVEIISQKNKKPSLDWLQIVKTREAKKKIKATLKKLYPNIFQKNYILQIITKNRFGLLKDITNVIFSQGINIVSSKSKVKDNLVYILIEVKLSSKNEFSELKNLLKKEIKEIIKIN